MDNSLIHTPVMQDKPLWLVLLAPLFVAINKKFGLSFDFAELASMAVPLLGYVLASKHSSGKAKVAAIEAAVSKVAAEDPAQVLAEPAKP